MRSDGIEVSDNLHPPLAHDLESGGVLGEHGAGVNEANARCVLDPGQDSSDDGVQARAVTRVSPMSAFPGINEAFVRHQRDMA